MEIGIPESAVSQPASFASIITQAGATPVIGSMSKLARQSLDLMVVEGDHGYAAAVRSESATPLLPIDTTPGLEPITASDLQSALAALLDGAGEYVDRLSLSVHGNGFASVAATTVLMVTNEAAAISEFRVATPDQQLCQYRADGMLISTPGGTTGYPHAAGSSTIGPTVDALSVIPLSPYRTAADHWIIDPSGVTITVLRKETPVSLFVDAEEVGRIKLDEPVTIRGERKPTTLRLPQSTSPFETSP